MEPRHSGGECDFFSEAHLPFIRKNHLFCADNMVVLPLVWRHGQSFCSLVDPLVAKFGLSVVDRPRLSTSILLLEVRGASLSNEAQAGTGEPANHRCKHHAGCELSGMWDQSAVVHHIRLAPFLRGCLSLFALESQIHHVL